MRTGSETFWARDVVRSPALSSPIPCVAARNVVYIANAHRFQTVNIYLPATLENLALVERPMIELPFAADDSVNVLVHIHGGAWRDPNLTATSVEPTVAYAFAEPQLNNTLAAIVSLNYSLSPFPTHPTQPYDPIRDNHTDIAREAVHPQQISDVLHGFALLRGLGLRDDSYLLSGHSAGAFLAFAAFLRPPAAYGLPYLQEAPRPAVLIGLNGLYDLPALVSQDGLGSSHAHLRDDYEDFLSRAFGSDQRTWPGLTPTGFDVSQLEERVRNGRFPAQVRLEQSSQDQLVPMIQRTLLHDRLSAVPGVLLQDGDHLHGLHAQPWEEGKQLWATVSDVRARLRNETTRF